MKSSDFRIIGIVLWIIVQVEILESSTSIQRYYGLRGSEDQEIPQGAATLAFVFDTTGSMYDDLVQVINGAKKILNTILARKEKIIYNYVLVPFHDPDVGPVTRTTDTDFFQEQLRDLIVQGGGDCPEMSIGAIKLALEDCLPNSHIYVFTDARAKDYYLLEDVLKLIQRKQSQVVFVMTGDCGNHSHPGYQAYERIASTSSGQIFHLKKTDVKEVLNFVRLSLQARKVNLFALDRNIGDAKEIPFDIDGSLKEFTVSVSGENPQVTVINSRGEEVDSFGGLTELLSHRNISIVNIKDPIPGRWTIKASSGGAHTIRATGLSNIDFVHGFSQRPTADLQETSRRPLKGASTYLLVNGTELPQPATFQHVKLIDLEGNDLQNIPLYRLPDSSLFNATAFDPPNDYFYLQVAGIDELGYPIERITPTAISAQFPDVPEVTTRSRVSVYYDEDADLRCYIESLVPFSVVWYKDGIQISQEQNYPQTTETTLIVPEVTDISEGWYSCNATNIAGASSSSIELDVKEPPPIIQKPENVSALIDGQAILPCDAYSIVSHNITWKRLIEDDIKKGFYQAESIATVANTAVYPNGSLVFNNLQKNDEGWYRCTATNEGGSVQEHIYLNAFYLPAVKVSPRNVNFLAGQFIKIICSAAGYPVPSVQWKWDTMHDEAFFTGRSKIIGNSLTIDSAEPTDEGRYDCVASSVAGSKVASAQLTYVEAPVISLPEKEILVKNGDEAVLRCIAEGIPDPKVSWFKENNIEIHPLSYIQISDDGSLTIIGVQEVDAGSYTCVASNEAGKVNSTLTLSVGSKPSIVPLPSNISIEINGNGSIPCIASGLPQPHTSWRQDGELITKANARVSIAPSGHLHIQDAELLDQGKYFCIAENRFGTEMQQVEVFISGIRKPVISPFPDTTNVHKGQDKFLNCIILDGNPRAKIQWLQNSKAIESAHGISVQANGTLKISNAIEIHEGSYTCIATNVGGNASGTTFLNVLVSPQIFTDHQEISVVQGASVTLPCEVDGDPKPEISWLKDNHPISSSNFIIHNKDGSLTVKSAVENDSGTYVCVASNVVGTSENVLQLFVQVPPKIMGSKRIIEVVEGETIILPCEAYGVPAPTKRWRKLENDHINLEKLMMNTGNIQLKATIEDKGTYECEVANSAGKDAIEIQLVVFTHPTAQITTAPKAIIQGNELLLMCETTGYPSPYIFWKTNERNILPSANIIIKNNTLTIKKVERVQEGKYTCVAQNNIGNASDSQYVDVYEPPVIEQTNPRISAILGEELLIPCRATGYPEPKLAWKMPESLGFRQVKDEGLYIPYVQESDGGRYSCMATSIAGRHAVKFEVSVYAPPIFLSNDIQRHIEEITGSQIVLDCSVTAFPPPSVTWYKNGQEFSIQDETNILIENNGQRLVFQDLSSADAGAYVCRVMNRAGETSETFNVDVLVPPTLREPNFVKITSKDGEAFELDCYTPANPRPQLIWKKNRHVFNPHLIPSVQLFRNGTVLRIENVRKSDAGRYSCILMNKAGSSRREFEVSVLVPPIIQGDRFQYKEVLVRETVQLLCVVSGIPAPSIEWFKNGIKLVPGQLANFVFLQSGQKLAILETTELDSGLYACRASNNVGEATKETHLTILVPPYIDEQDVIQELRKKEKEDIALTCKVSGYPHPHIVWTKDGRVVTQSTFPDILLNHENQELELKNIQEQDAGRYSCIATNKAGAQAKDFMVNILTPPTLGTTSNFMNSFEESSAQEVSENWPIQLFCPFTGNPLPRLTWMKDNEIVVNSSNTVISGDGKYLRVNHAHVSDSGKYMCIARNDAGENKKEFEVKVLAPPNIAGAPLDRIHVAESDSMFLNCNVSGNPPPSIHWLKDGMELILSNENQTFVSKDKTTIEFQKAKLQNAGRYICVASNIVGSKEKEFIVDVLVPPTFEVDDTNFESNVIAHANKPATFQCKVKAYPIPEIKWFRNGEFLNYTEESNIFIHSGGEKLTILRTRDIDSGTYSCVVTNQVGANIMDFNLNVLVSPFVVQEKIKSTYYAKEGEAVTIKCPVAGNPKPLITWLKDSDVILPNPVAGTELSNESQHLILNHVLIKDSGKYTCIASNEVGMIENDFKLHVQVPPRLDGFQETKQSYSVVLNKPITLSCPVSGIPPPVVQWFKGSRGLELDPNVAISADGKTLSIFRTKVSDAALYTCKAANIVGNTKMDFDLNVQLPPKLVVPNNGRSDVFETIEEDLSELIKIPENTTIRMDCFVSGDPKPIILWLKEGNLLKANSSEGLKIIYDGQQLIITNVKLSHAGHYTCVASNVAGTTERDFFLEVQVPPVVLGNPEELEEVQLNRPVLMDCQVDSQPPAVYTWLKDDKFIDFTKEDLMTLLDDGKKLQILKTHPNHGGRFTCTVDNEVGRVQKHFNLDVYVPPVIQNSSISHDVIENGTVYLECLSTGNPKPDITWLRNLDILSENKPSNMGFHFKHDKQLLEITNVTANFSGKYKCIASNSMGSTEKDFKLVVLVPPKIIASSTDNTTAIAHTTVELNCEARGHPPPVILWFKDGHVMQDFSNPFLHILDHGEILQLSRVRETDSGHYSCEVTNSVGTDRRNFFLDILVPPKFNADEQKISLLTQLEGNDVDLNCSVTGNPTPNVMWFKNGKPLIITEPSRFMLLEDNQVLRIFTVKVEDGNDYICRASSNLASAEKVFNLFVQAPPRILGNSSSDLIGELSQPLFIPCAASGNPRPVISWMKNGQFVDPFSEPNLHILEEESSLLIRFAGLEDSGTYTCLASNLAGQTEKHFSINVHTPPRIDRSNYLPSQTVIYNKSAIMDCPVSGIPRPAIIWTKNGTQISAFSQYQQHQIMKDGEQFIINSVTENDEGQYSCSIINHMGTDEIDYNLKVLVPPQISPSSAQGEFKVTEGENVILDCPVYQSDYAEMITWAQDGTPLNPNTIPHHFAFSNDHKQLKIMKAQSSDAGSYTCKAMNSAGSAEHEMYLNITGQLLLIPEGGGFTTVSFMLAVSGIPPRIMYPVEKHVILSVTEQQSITLECNVQGKPQPTIEWKKNNNSISVALTSKIGFPTNDKLRITDISPSEAGFYSCIATNEAGMDERLFELNVDVPPRLNISPNELHKTAIQNSDVTLNCGAEGIPPPRVLWYKDSQLIIPGKGIFFSEDSMTLQISKITVADVGKYSCMAVNKAGTSEVEFFVKVHAPPMVEQIGIQGDQDVVLNHSVRLFCDAQGLPSPNITWYKDQIPIQNLPGVYSLSGGGRFFDIESANVSDMGTYTCRAENQEGSAEKAIFLNVLVPPDIAAGNMSVSHQAVIGEPLKIECPTTGSPPPLITWLKNGFPISENEHTRLLENNHVLWFDSVSLFDSAEYTCIASNNAGSTEHGFNLTVLVPPSIASSDEEDMLSVIRGHPLVITCSFSGHPSPDITWMKDGNILTAADSVSTDEGTLHLQSVETHDNGIYSCEASNVVGKSSKHYEVIVMVPPEIIDNSGPTLITSNIGEPVLMECHASGAPYPTTTWLKNGLPLLSNYKSNFQIMNNSTTLVILNPRKSDSGLYKCVSSNPAGNSSKHFFLSILEPPSIKDHPEFLNSVVGSQVTINCEASGHPEPEITWLKDGYLLPEPNDEVSLHFQSVKLEDAGNYTCYAINEAGEAVHNTQLTVMSPPVIRNSKNDVKVFIGDAVVLFCDAIGYPIPSVMWHKDSKMIYNDSDHTIFFNNSLHLPAITFALAGIYTCVAENEAGVQEATRKVEVLSLPVIKDTFKDTYTTVQAQQVILNCEANGIPLPEISWEKNGYSVEQTRMKSLQLGQIGSLHISLVQPSDMGSYDCVAKNEAGLDKKSTKLIVWVPPTIDKMDPTSIITVQGRTLEIPCKANGFPPPQISWQMNGEGISSHSAIQPNGALEIVNIQAEDSADYSCVAVNNAGRDYRSVKVEVHVPPVITQFSKSQDISIGSSLSLSCEASGIPSPTITWLLNNTLVAGQALPSKGYSEFVIENAGKADEGTYACLAQNKVGERRAVVAVRVHSPPIVIEYPGVHNAHLKDAVMLDCVVNGDPTPNIIWIKNGQRIHYNHRIQQVENGSLVIYNSLDEDSGKYKCIARNDFGSAESTAELIIRRPPTFVIEPHNIVAGLGDSINMDCKVEGEPKPIVSWEKDGVKIEDNDESFVLANHTLRIIAVQLADEGLYSCVSSNDLGNASSEGHLIVKVDGMWSQWQDWSPCSISCGDGVQVRHRLCENPPPRNGGKSCLGIASESKFCKELDCAVDGEWGNWMDWQSCSAACGIGSRKRQRLCNNPSPEFGGKACIGDQVEEDVCLIKECPVDGGWSFWTDWQPCSTSCGTGTQIRFRECDDPPPAHGGLQCFGEEQQTQECFLQNCPVDGEWSSWSEWSFCSMSCGGGRQTRERECNSPSPAFGGRECIGPDIQINYCNNYPCPVNGGWSVWSPWGICSASCNMGHKKRFRTCSDPTPVGGGRECMGPSQEIEVCNAHLCPVDGKWSNWSNWSPCSVTCGVGVRERFRSCDNPEPSYDGKDCAGEGVQLDECENQACDVLPFQARGHLLGTINGMDIGPSIMNTTIVEFGMGRQIISNIDNTPHNLVPLMRLLIPLLSPIYWTVAYEVGNAANGYTLTRGVFSRETQIDFGTGETLYMSHVARGLDKGGNLLVDTVISGEAPDILSSSVIIIHPYIENYVQMGPGLIYAFSAKTYKIDDFVLPYFWNHTIFYTDLKRKMPFIVQKLHVDGIKTTYNFEKREMNYTITSTISKGFHGDDVQCPEGFIADSSGSYCNDINECQSIRPCSHLCYNSPGSYSCYCPVGFIMGMDEHTCFDIDECDMNISNCSITQECTNTVGSYKCAVICDEGFKRTDDDMYCKDINECETTPKLCSQKCTNSIGSYSCQCRPGFFLVGRSSCIDIDECRFSISPCSHTCINAPGSYFCLCPDGYELLDDKNCQDINECESGTYYCPRGHICENTEGNYNCLKPCEEGLKYSSNGTCVDIDECLLSLPACHFTQICINTHGSYHCSCAQGYFSEGPGKPCKDINECLQIPSPCNYDCHNTNGGYDCICAPGHKRLPDRKTCAGIEYLEEDKKRLTQNNAQSYQWNGYVESLHNDQTSVVNCSVGYTVRYGTCQDINECEIKGNCQHLCENTPGSFRCICPTGYKLSSSKRSCEDVDECRELNISCGYDKMCFNMKGSFECIDTPCPPSYERNPLTKYCELTCEEANIACPPGVKYADILAFKMVALPSHIKAYQDLVRLVAYDQDGRHLPNTLFTVIENDTGVPFRISLEDGKGVLYSQKDMESNREYKIKVKAISYDDDNQTILYTTKFLVFLSVSKYPY